MCTTGYHRGKWQTRPVVRDGAPPRQNRKCLDNKNLILDPTWGLTPRPVGRLTVGPNVTSTLTRSFILIKISYQQEINTKCLFVSHNVNFY
jgi:hypothetical protein